MKKSLFLFFVLFTVCVLLPRRGWTHGMHFGGGYGGGHFSGGYHSGYFGGGQFSSGSHHFHGGLYRNFGGPVPYTNYGSPAFRSPGFGYSPYHSYPPYFDSQYSYRRGVPFFSPGFSSHRYVYRQRFGYAGPPPAGAPGPAPFAPATPTRPLPYFYCVEHAFRYTNQQAFFGHLNFAHKVPLKNAAVYCQPVENGLIFSGR